MDTLRWFEFRAKLLLRAHKAGDEHAVALARKYLLDRPDEVSLQRMQHCMAKSVGFNGWHALRAASEGERLRIIQAVESKEQEDDGRQGQAQH